MRYIHTHTYTHSNAYNNRTWYVNMWYIYHTSRHRINFHIKFRFVDDKGNNIIHMCMYIVFMTSVWNRLKKKQLKSKPRAKTNQKKKNVWNLGLMKFIWMYIKWTFNAPYRLSSTFNFTHINNTAYIPLLLQYNQPLQNNKKMHAPHMKYVYNL